MLCAGGGVPAEPPTSIQSTADRTPRPLLISETTQLLY